MIVEYFGRNSDRLLEIILVDLRNVYSWSWAAFSIIFDSAGSTKLIGRLKDKNDRRVCEDYLCWLSFKLRDNIIQ